MKTRGCNSFHHYNNSLSVIRLAWYTTETIAGRPLVDFYRQQVYPGRFSVGIACIQHLSCSVNWKILSSNTLSCCLWIQLIIISPSSRFQCSQLLCVAHCTFWTLHLRLCDLKCHICQIIKTPKMSNARGRPWAWMTNTGSVVSVR